MNSNIFFLKKLLQNVTRLCYNVTDLKGDELMRYILVPLINKGFSDINPTVYGRERCVSGHNPGRTVREYCLIHYVTSGCGTFESPKGKFKIKKGQLFVIRANETNYYYADEKDPWVYSWVGFSGDMQKYFENTDKVVFEYDGNAFKEMEYIEKNKNMREEYLASKVMMLIHELFRGEEPSPDIVQMTSDYIDNNFMRDIRVEDIANIVGFNRRYLSRIFKESTGKTLQEYLIYKRLEFAKKLLLDGYRVGEVSEMCGYRDTANFSRMFKKNMGLSPNEVIKK